jgi:hypothetical protein
VESTVVEVLILNGFGEGGFYKMVILAERKILGEFEGLRGGRP